MNTRAALERQEETEVADQQVDEIPAFLRDDGDEHAAGVSAEGDTSEGEDTGDEAEEASAKAHPGTDDSPDLEAFPETIRATLLEALSGHPDVLEELKKGYLRQDRYTKRRQDEKPVVEAARAVLDESKNWRSLVEEDALRDLALAFIKGDERAVQYVQSFGRNGHKAEQPSDEDLEERLGKMSPREYAEYLEKRLTDRLKPMIEAAPKQAVEAMSAPKRHATDLERATIGWAGDNDVDHEIAATAAVMLVKDHGGVMNVDEATLTRLLPRYVQAAQYELASKPATDAATKGDSKKGDQGYTARPGEAARAASPKPRGGSALPRPKKEIPSFDDPDAAFNHYLETTGQREEHLNAAAARRRGRA